ncbi:hypothetical protein RCL1_003591 [Eukaryota sp. TZLM3-RCL]
MSDTETTIEPQTTETSSPVPTTTSVTSITSEAEEIVRKRLAKFGTELSEEEFKKAVNTEKKLLRERKFGAVTEEIKTTRGNRQRRSHKSSRPSNKKAKIEEAVEGQSEEKLKARQERFKDLST